jgi:hypothetical protein
LWKLGILCRSHCDRLPKWMWTKKKKSGREIPSCSNRQCPFALVCPLPEGSQIKKHCVPYGLTKSDTKELALVVFPFFFCYLSEFD